MDNIHDIIKLYKSINIDINFKTEEADLEDILMDIKSFGKISINNFKFKDNFYDFNIYGEEGIILTKTRNDEKWSGNICRNELDISKEYIWKIKILNSKEYKIKIGIIVNDFDSNRPTLSDIGWYYDLSDNTLYHVDKKKNKKKKKKIEESDESSSDSYKYKKKKKISKKSKKFNESNLDKYKYRKKKKNIKKKEESEESSSDSSSDSFSDSSKYKNKKKNIKEKEESEESNSESNKSKKSYEKKNLENINRMLKNVLREILVIFNPDKNSLKFVEHNQIKGEFNNITKENFLPAVFLYNTNDTIEIVGFY